MNNYGDEERNIAVGVLAGIGIGVLVGAVTALLLAPKTGEETRDDVSKSLTELTDKVSELGKTLSYKVTTAVDRTRAQMAQKMGDATNEPEETVS
jgi:gas vesicle protein